MSAGWFARLHDWRPPVLAGLAACAGVLVYDTRPSRIAALVAVFAFELVALARPSRVLWSAPIIGTAVLLAESWRAIGLGGGLVYATGLVVTAAVAGAFGALPWASRWFAFWAARGSAAFHYSVWAATFMGATAVGGVALALPSTRPVLVPLAGAQGSALTAMALVAVRQWRFDTRRRTIEATLELAAAGIAVLAYPSLALDGHGWALALLIGALVTASLVAWPLALLAASAIPSGASNANDELVPLR